MNAPNEKMGTGEGAQKSSTGGDKQMNAVTDNIIAFSESRKPIYDYRLPVITNGFHGETVDGIPASSFCVKDLARSALVPSDFPFGVEVLPPNDEEQERYQFGITATYNKVRVNRAENKYYGPKGVTPPIATFGEFHDANITATVEGYKKALLFYITTGIPTIALDGCWMFGELYEEDQEAPVKNLASKILSVSPPENPMLFSLTVTLPPTRT